jgi:hypothetical protein
VTANIESFPNNRHLTAVGGKGLNRGERTINET